MKFPVLRKFILAVGLGSAVLTVSACDPLTTSASVGGSVYYDSMLWNDYYYGRPGPPAPKPPDRPGTRPPRPEHPIARPPVARPPIHRPPGGGRPRAGRI